MASLGRFHAAQTQPAASLRLPAQPARNDVASWGFGVEIDYTLWCVGVAHERYTCTTHAVVCTIGMHVQKVGNGRQYAIGLYLGIERSEAYGSRL